MLSFLPLLPMSTSSPISLDLFELKKLLKTKETALERLDQQRVEMSAAVEAYRTVVKDLERQSVSKVSKAALRGSSMSRDEEAQRRDEAVKLMEENGGQVTVQKLS